MKQENRSCFKWGWQKNRKCRSDSFVFLFVLLVIPISVFAQSVSKSPTVAINLPTGQRPPKPTPVPTSINNRPGTLPPHQKLPIGFEMGLSSADAPEKYVRTKMFEISTADFLKKYGWPGRTICQVDGKENVYLTFQRAVVVIDKTGKELRVIENLSPNSRNNILVDEDGNLFIREYGVVNGRAINSIRVFDSNGEVIAQPEIKDWHVFESEDVRFSHGIIHSLKTGEIFYKLPNTDEKEVNEEKIQKDLKFKLTGDKPTQYEMDDHDNWMPRRIDGFNFKQIMAVDSFGDIYAKYEQGSFAGEHPVWEEYRLYKFNSKFRLLASFDFYPNDINLQTGTLYHLENGQLMKWEKPVKP